MLPGNICLRYVLPHVQLGSSVITFGVLVTCMAAARNYQTILALRILIGAAQAFMQGLGLYVTLWYKRDEVATRGGKPPDQPFYPLSNMVLQLYIILLLPSQVPSVALSHMVFKLP